MGLPVFGLTVSMSLIAVSRLYEARNLHITLSLPGKDQSTQMEKHSMKFNKDSSLAKLSPFCIHVFFRSRLLYLEKHPWPYSWIAAHHSANTILVFLPNGFLKPPKWTQSQMLDANSNSAYPAYPVPKILNKFKNHEDAENADPPSPAGCLKNPEISVRSARTPPKSCVAQSLQGLVSTIQKNAPLHQIAFLTWALAGSTCIYVWSLKLLSDCNAVCRSILRAINKYAHVRSLTFLGLQWIEFETFKGCKMVQILKEQSWKSSQLQFQGTNFNMVFAPKTLWH